MSRRYRLMPRDGNIPYQKIMTGRKWVGRVVKHATEPGYLGIIKPLSVRAATAAEAFDEVVAQHLGYENADALRNRNRQVRRATRVANQAADYLASEYFRGNTELLEKVIDSGGIGLAIRGVTRSLRK